MFVFTFAWISDWVSNPAKQASLLFPGFSNYTSKYDVTITDGLNFENETRAVISQAFL